MRDNRHSAEQSWKKRLNTVYCILLLLLILTCVVLSARLVVRAFEQRAQANARPRITGSSLGPVYTSSGETIKVYVFIDPETDIQYLVSDRGGITPRLTNDTFYEEREL